MADIRKYIQDTLLDPLKYYPTAIQDTLLEIITEKLETLYNYTLVFPEIVTPTRTRLDILKTIADQFLFTIRDEADLQEQIDILDNILTVYNKRGSIDTIENMWKYYGGDLPRDVQVIVPSYNLFRWDISPYSGVHVFEDGGTNRTGVYEIKLTNSNYDIPRLRDFLLKELVAAGNQIYFTNALSAEIREDRSSSYFLYDIVKEDDFLHLQLTVPQSFYGLSYSGPSASVAMSGQYNEVRDLYDHLTEEQKSSGDYDSIVNAYKLLSVPDLGAIWSGKENIFVDVTDILESEIILYNYITNMDVEAQRITNIIEEIMKVDNALFLSLEPEMYSTPSYLSIHLYRDLYNDQDERMRDKLFTLAESNLGEPLGYEPY